MSVEGRPESFWVCSKRLGVRALSESIVEQMCASPFADRLRSCNYRGAEPSLVESFGVSRVEAARRNARTHLHGTQRTVHWAALEFFPVEFTAQRVTPGDIPHLSSLAAEIKPTFFGTRSVLAAEHG